ncbi:glycosyltransferase family 2 protein [Mucilaginibacter gotjawali]|uniref:Glycosyltransferase involved in cell wall biosynthesis n=1 Tax=Mucilaginibacter gotjawali TaxID=1550579 RepID=A0A839SFQ9_9SPHI|nr:glycosyltransferase [Mucilaginibacter gotjawali]MBB3057101.1 glycosyltransferase involved in cell wall biosynthesis [Mucilaginibacter gotjawali]
MDVSIIIPTYNRLWSLPKTVESCRNNKCAVELIVIDDGSTDGTMDWLRQQNGIVILQQTNRGKCWAVNRGFAIAKGKYIKFLDSDDGLAVGAIDEQFAIAEGNSSDIVVSGYTLVDENGKQLSQQAWVACDDFIAQQLGECDSSHYSAYLFKKSFIEDIPHRPDFAFRDDRLFVIEAALKHPKVNVHNGCALVHTSHTKSKLQLNRGMQKAVQDYQHLNIYKNILAQLAEKGELTERRKKASVKALWPLCCWIARHDLEDSVSLFEWIKQLDPDFKIPDKGLTGFLYKSIGVNNTHRLLKIKRSF